MGRAASKSLALLPPTELYANLDAEKVLDQMGRFGRYQMLVYAMASVAFLVYACETMIMGLIGGEPDGGFNCTLTPEGVRANLTVLDQCTVWSKKEGNLTCGDGVKSVFVYHSSDRRNLASDYDLVCADQYGAQHGTSSFMIGMHLSCADIVSLIKYGATSIAGSMVTTPVLIQLADRYGRRLTFLISLWLTVASNIACSLAPSYWLFILFRFSAGLWTAGIGTIGFVIMIEAVAPSFRTLTPLFSTIVWVGGYMTVGVLHVYIKDWRRLYFALSAPGGI